MERLKYPQPQHISSPITPSLLYLCQMSPPSKWSLASVPGQCPSPPDTRLCPCSLRKAAAPIDRVSWPEPGKGGKAWGDGRLQTPIVARGGLRYTHSGQEAPGSGFGYSGCSQFQSCADGHQRVQRLPILTIQSTCNSAVQEVSGAKAVIAELGSCGWPRNLAYYRAGPA